MRNLLVNPFVAGHLDSRSDARRPPLLLVIDDQIGNHQVLKTVFSRDHVVVTVPSGSKALESCQTQLPDLILLAPMGQGEGYEFCRQLKDDVRTRYVPVVFVAEQEDAEEEIRGLDVGAVDFIVRPVSAAVLRARVKTHLMLRRATKQILAFNATLERKVEERTGELQSTVEALHEFQSKLVDSEARATLGMIVANVSHELTTPISNSMLTVNALAQQTDAFNELVDGGQIKRTELGVFLKVLREGTGLMERNLHRAQALIGSFKQVASDQVSEERREFDLAAVVEDTIASMMPGLKSKPHRIVVDIPREIAMDSLPGAIGQVIVNLVNNAYLHAFDGRADGVLTIRAALDGDQVLLSFNDNGAGMSAATQERIFQPFFTTRKGKGGTGLGMPIVKDLVRKSLRGSLKVSSTVGLGTRFELRLPQSLPSLY